MSKALKIFHAFLWPVGEMQIECETKPLNMQQTDTEPYNRQIVACCLLFVACLLPSEGGSATYRISISLQCQVQRYFLAVSLKELHFIPFKQIKMMQLYKCVGNSIFIDLQGQQEAWQNF